MADVGSSQTSVNLFFFEEEELELERLGVTLTPLFCFCDTNKTIGQQEMDGGDRIGCMDGWRDGCMDVWRGGMWTTWVGWDVVEDVLLFGVWSLELVVCCL